MLSTCASSPMLIDVKQSRNPDVNVGKFKVKKHLTNN